VTGRIALVIGAIRGIGKAAGIDLAREFACVTLVTRSAEDLAALDEDQWC
jgi:NAD(P)-dependent dehydrogenase (short-subunit alcohol dehydrogenase family)